MNEKNNNYHNFTFELNYETKDEIIDEFINDFISFFKDIIIDLIDNADKQTDSKEEVICYLKGACLLLNVLTGNIKNVETSALDTIDDTIEYINDMLPFLYKGEKENHQKLLEWLKELKTIKMQKK